MTRTFQFATVKGDSTINPLFVKMKNRFFHNDRAVGDLLRQRMESVEIESAQPVKEERDTAAEHRVTRANFLPKEKSTSSSHAMRSFESTVFMNRQLRATAPKTQHKKKKSPPIMLILLSALFVIIMMTLIYMGMQINKKNNQVNDLKAQIAAKEAQAVELENAISNRIDIDEIQKTAIENLNMVKIDTVEHVYIDLNSGDAVELHGAERDSDLLLRAFEESFGN